MRSRPGFRSIRTAALAAGALSALLGACAPEETQPEPTPSMELPETETGAFEDRMDLLRSVEEGTFADRADLGHREQLRVPDPMRIDFESGTDLPRDQVDTLRELASLLNSNHSLRVDLVGCSDPPGSAAVNRRVSRQRAESVAEQLRRLDVFDGQIGGVEGQGEDCEVQERHVRAVFSLRDPEG